MIDLGQHRGEVIFFRHVGLTNDDASAHLLQLHHGLPRLDGMDAATTQQDEVPRSALDHPVRQPPGRNRPDRR